MANAKQFKASIVLGGSVAGSLKTAFGNVESGVKRIGSEVSALTKKQKMLGDSIQMLGKQGKNIDKWRERYSLVTKEVDKLRIAQIGRASCRERVLLMV